MELATELLFLWLPSTILLFFILNHTLWRPSNHGRLPPGPTPLPIIGNLHILGHKPHRSLARLAKTYGPLMAVKLGMVTTIVISSPDMAREVLQKKDQSFFGRSVPDAVRALSAHSASVVWRPADQTWRKLRKFCSTQLFMSKKLDQTRALRRQKVRDLISYVHEHCVAGEAVDISKAAFTTMLNLVSNTLFSIDLADPRSGSDGSGFKDLVWALMEESGSPNLSDFFPSLAWMDVQGRRRAVGTHLKKLYGIFDELIDQRLQLVADPNPNLNSRRGAEASDFLDSIIQCHIGDDSQDLWLDRHTMKCLLGDLFIAGTDTSSHTVEWAMAELLRNPSSLEKVRLELVETIGKEVEESDIHRFRYLQAIVKETLRLHPPTPLLIPHRAEEDTELCGYLIPKGTRVLVNAWAIGRDSDVWEDSEMFIPERFLGRDVDYRGRDFELIPFGAGRRTCPGLPLAFLMVHLMLASLICSFDWKLPDGMQPADVDMEEKFGLTLAKAVPLRAVPVLSAIP